MNRIIAMLIILSALVITPLAADAPVSPVKASDILTWPRMPAPDFGCMIETKFGFSIKNYSCSDVSKKHDWGDPCKNYEAYYSGPVFPNELGPKIHPSIETLELGWENGKLQNLTVHFNKAMKDAEVENMFWFELDGPYPSNISSVTKQQCGNAQSCLTLQGFIHMGAGDVDCREGTVK